MSKLAWKIVDCTMTTTRHTLLAAVLDTGLGGGGGGGESSAADVGLPSIEILKERKKERKNENDKIFLNHSHPRGGWTPHIKGVAMLVGNLITRMITDRIGLHSVLLPLLIIIIKAKLCAKVLI